MKEKKVKGHFRKTRKGSKYVQGYRRKKKKKIRSSRPSAAIQKVLDRATKRPLSKLKVYTAVPERAFESVMDRGLLSGHLMAKDPKLVRLARSKEDAKEWTERYNKRGKDKFWKVAYDGPSVFFGLPDRKKITKEHYLNRFKTRMLEIDLGRMIADEPRTHIHGFELVPYKDWVKADDRGEKLSRRAVLSPEEVDAYTQQSPEEMWKHYFNTKYYAADVPHGALVTPDGRVDPKYLRELPMYHGSPEMKRRKKLSSVMHISGPSGSGKTTFLRSLENYETKDLDEFDDEARSLIGKAGISKKYWADGDFNKHHKQKQKLLRSYLKTHKDKNVVLGGHYREGLNKLDTSADEKILLGTGALRSAFRRYKRSLSGPNPQKLRHLLSNYRTAKKTIEQAKSDGYVRMSAKEIRKKLARP